MDGLQKIQQTKKIVSGKKVGKGEDRISEDSAEDIDPQKIIQHQDADQYQWCVPFEMLKLGRCARGRVFSRTWEPSRGGIRYQVEEAKAVVHHYHVDKEL